ncbi:MAG TPA: DNA replication/repair protein RecF [Eubacteriales bacterium]|jgi:DNA replication and repair protein RecF|nr:DNA replication/repair protein RecF [Eubacteriales bacterium]HRU84049.1 DNA replication/repair protein RecF [Eubacteriales bacterium]
MDATLLKLKNFRNYLEKAVEFSSGLNVIEGKNATGKTNLLEAVYLSAFGRSPRAVKDKEMINHGASQAQVRLNLEKKFRSHKIEVFLLDNNKKSVLIDGIPAARSNELLGMLSVVYFSPDELKLIKNSPEERRRFMDVSLCQQKKAYFFALSGYNRLLKQRNALLKESNSKAIADTLDIWDAEMAKTGAEIIFERAAFLKGLEADARRAHYAISGGGEELSLLYETETSGQTKEELRAGILEALKAGRERDLNLKYTGAGPHRDDIKIALDGRDARKFASQGQIRTSTLALKVAETALIKAETGESPVLLLDDVLSELDESRQAALLNFVSGTQVIVSCTEFKLSAVKPDNIIRTTPV